MQIAWHSSKRHIWMFKMHQEVVRTCVTCMLHFTPARSTDKCSCLHTQEGGVTCITCMLHCTSAKSTDGCSQLHTKDGGATCKLFKKVVGVSHDVLPIKISRPSFALSLWATLISLRVTPPTTKATMRFPCNTCMLPLSSDIANSKQNKERLHLSASA